ncbi:hypothetical protein BDY19DRAFT_1023578 [Irpex rosettiformis]|uniref:Uncharacterized protein n=1 Tax=Irpex rosettiformis TaxID=378272 RepID=A0ACB8TS88_9APHY|nr:hypothetical protein BDY19DRAFT_1023578 [Irpex rosettiformis]
MALDPLIKIKVTSAVCSSFAILTTAGRMYLRRAKYWWDDACAFLATIFLLVQVAAVFMHLPDPHVMSRTTRIAAYYIMAIIFYLIIWTARLAILYSIIRIDPNPSMRRILNCTAVVFVIIELVMCAQLFWVCESEPSWKNKASPQCPLTKQVAILQLVTDVLADVLLIVAPLRLLRQLSTQDGTRRRLMIIFSSSIVTTIVSLVHAALILTIGGVDVVIAALVENTFSVIVCNVPVVVTFLLRRSFRFGDSEGRKGTGEDATSTFGWWKARTGGSAHLTTGGFGGRSGITVARTVENDISRDVTTINLWDLSANRDSASRSKDRIDDGQTREGAFTISQMDRVEEEELGGGVKGERDIVWLTTETFRHTDTKDQDDDDSLRK